MRRSLIGLAAAGLVAAASSAALSSAAEDGELKNPYLGQKEAIEEGKRIYRGRCISCHRQMGGRGPNLFATKLTDEQFLEVVTNGRYGARGQMPVFGLRMSPDEIWKVHAYIKSTDHYE